MKTEASRRYLTWLLAHRKLVNLVALVLTVASLVLASRLPLRSSFSELLPDELPSVVQLKSVTERLGGTGFLLVGVESPDFAANKRFVEALAAKIETLPKESIRYYEYRYLETRNFIERYGLHFLNEGQLTRLRDHVRSAIEQTKGDKFGDFLGLDDEPATKTPETPPNLRTTVTEAFDPRVRRFLEYPDAYIGTDDGKLLVIRILPLASSLSVDKSRHLTQEVRRMIEELRPSSFHANMKVGFAGSVQRSIEEYETIRADIADTAVELVILILIALFLFFWSWRWLFLLVANLAIGTAWTFGLTRLSVGYLNTQTAFLGSLVVGTGINYGVIFLARYLEERRAGRGIEEALTIALRSTSLGTLLGSSTTALSFACLLIADNKGLSQFGFIGCLGILCCWISAYALLPIWIHVWETRFPRRSYRHPLASVTRRFGENLGEGILRFAPGIAAFLMIVSVLGYYGFRKLAANPLEYNFAKLQNKVAVNGGSAALNGRIQSEVFKSNLSVSVITTESPEEAKELCPTVRRLAASMRPSERVFEGCSSLWDLLPTGPRSPEEAVRNAKLRDQIRELFGRRIVKLADPQVAAVAERIHREASERAPTLQDLPKELTRRFEEQDGTLGFLGFISPDSKKPLEDARNLFLYTSSFEQIFLPKTARFVSAAGDAWVIADLLKTIRVDGPKISLLAFIGVVLLTFLMSGSVRGGFLMAFCLIAATWWQFCFQGLNDIKFNFFNFIALPVTFGIGVDYPINIFLRIRETGLRNFGRVMSSTGAAVLLCSTTTLIGYYTLLGASNQALTSFAQLAIIGEFACLAAAFLLLPITMAIGRGISSRKNS